MALQPIAPGKSPQFRLTPEPAGVATSIDNIGWAVESSDGTTDVAMMSNLDDPTGMTATLFLDSGIAVGTTISFWCVYRNPSGTETLGGPWNFTVVAA